MTARLSIKRVYEPVGDSDGRRILVDRIWPRGLTKEKASVDLWLKDVAPSTELRKWYGHDAEKWAEFRERYMHELRLAPDALDRLRREIAGGPSTLVFAAHDAARSNAAVLVEALGAIHAEKE